VFFKSLDDAFNGTTVVSVMWHQLVLHVIGGEKNLQSGGCLIVESLEFWFKTLDSEFLMDVIIGLEPL
jgi:hypothetical protein